MPDADKSTPRPWTHAASLTGPTTPNVFGPCCRKDWPYQVLAVGYDTVAILPAECGPDDQPVPGSEFAAAVKVRRAVNAHDALVAVVRKLLGYGCAPEWPESRQDAWDCATEEAEAALKLAEAP